MLDALQLYVQDDVVALSSERLFDEDAMLVAAFLQRHSVIWTKLRSVLI